MEMGEWTMANNESDQPSLMNFSPAMNFFLDSFDFIFQRKHFFFRGFLQEQPVESYRFICQQVVQFR